MNLRLALCLITSIVAVLPIQSAGAADKPFPDVISLPNGFAPEGFAIGRGTSAYSGSMPTGAIYKSDLRTGQGKVLVLPKDNPNGDALALGMRVDTRTNYLFVAGGSTGKTFVYDADSGASVAEYQLGPSDGSSLNGIVATPNGRVLIIANSNQGTLYRVDPATGHADAISVSPAVVGFMDGMVLINRTLYILTPADPAPADAILVVDLDKDLLTGTIRGRITGPNLDQPASLARFGDSFYAINARWFEAPTPDTAYWITKLNMHDIQP